MTDHYVSYSQAMALKRLGFAEEVMHYYTQEEAPEGQVWLTTAINPHDYNQPREWNEPKPLCSVMRLDQAQAWLREVKRIIVWISPEFYEGDDLKEVKWYFYAQPMDNIRNQRGCKAGRYYSSDNEALSAGIDAAIKILEEMK